MPSSAEIQKSLNGVWRMMTGRPDGLRHLDLSADGFWDSFFAIVVALPPLIFVWAGIASDFAVSGIVDGSKLSILLRLAAADIGAWIIPIAALAAMARPVGIADRFTHYIVATNWASALLVWPMLVPALLRTFSPDAETIAETASVLVFIVSMGLMWPVTNTALGKGPLVATAVFVAMFVASVALQVFLQSKFGLYLPASAGG